MSDYVPLFQEELKDRDPFWMLVACALVNLTHWRQAKPVFEELFVTCDGKSWNLMRIPDEDLVEILRPLGLQTRRARNLKAMCEDWQDLLASRIDEHDKEVYRKDILKLSGCGQYAADSWAIFMEGDLSVEPTDGRLNEYLEHQKKFGRSAHSG